jgi:HEAT repeat protein
VQKQDVFSGEWEEKRRFNIDLLKKDQNVDGLIGALQSEDALTRQRAALALGDFGDAKAIEPLIRVLGDPVQGVREAAADSLSMMGKPAVEPLIELIEHPERSKKYEAPSGHLPAFEEPSLRREPPAGIEGMEEEEGVTVQGVRPGMAWDVETRRDLRRTYAAAVLGEIGEARAVDTLVRALKDENTDLRCQASGALIKMGSGAVQPVARMLTDQNPDIRVVAAGVLGDIGDPSAVDILISALHDDTDDVRGAAAGALVQIGSPAVDSLIEATNDDDRWVRLYAAGALKYIGDPRAIDALEELARDEDPDVRSVAEDAIEKIRMVREGMQTKPTPPTSR